MWSFACVLCISEDGGWRMGEVAKERHSAETWANGVQMNTTGKFGAHAKQHGWHTNAGVLS